MVAFTLKEVGRFYTTDVTICWLQIHILPLLQSRIFSWRFVYNSSRSRGAWILNLVVLKSGRGASVDSGDQRVGQNNFPANK